MASWTEIVTFTATLPGVQEAVSYGEPSLKVGRSLLTRMPEADQSIVLLDVVRDERDMLIAVEPEVFFVEPHYEGYPIVLARLAKADLSRLSVYVERRWRNIASKKLIKAYEDSHENR